MARTISVEEIKKYGIEKGFLDSILEDNEKVLSIGSNKNI